MKTTLRKLFFASCFVALGLTRTVHGSGVVTSATEANFRAALAGGGTVTFAVSGTITFASTIVITNDTVIDAAGQSITLSGGGTVRVLTVPTNVSLTLKNLTVANGNDPSGFNGCGGIVTSGDLKVIGCTFSNNVAAAFEDNAGAIRHAGNATGPLTVLDSTFVNNIGFYGAGAIDTGNGGVNYGMTTYGLRLTNCTFYGNSGGSGAIIARRPFTTASWIVNCTIAGNTNTTNPTVWEGPAMLPYGAGLAMVNTILASNVGHANATGLILDHGHNLSSDNSAVFTNATSFTNTNPLLGQFADNGGATWTLAPLANSPAIDSGDLAAAPPADQRGVSRPKGATADIGAFEGTQSLTSATTMRFWADAFAAGESGGVAVIRIERTGPSGVTSSVDFSATSGTASGTDFVATNVTVSFAFGEAQKTVHVTLINDNSTEGNETVLLSLTNPVGAALGAPATATLSILDDEVPQNLVACTYAGVATAINNGGWYVFDCDTTIVFPTVINVISNTVLDANGHNVVFDGANASRLFNVDAGKTLTLKNLKLTRGRFEAPGASVPGGTGPEGAGGAITINGGTVNLVDCKVWTNSVVGGWGAGYPGNMGGTGNGGAGSGGAILVNGGTFNATRTEFAGNVALGGEGARTGMLGGAHGFGGLGSGGAIYNRGGDLSLQDCSFVQNTARGGAAPWWSVSGLGSGGDVSGSAAGGAIAGSNGTSVVSGCLFQSNLAMAAPGTNPPALSGGEAFGGAVYFHGGATIINSTFANNQAMASKAALAYGGGVFERGGTLALVNVTLSGNGAFPGPAYVGSGQGGNLATTNGTLQLINTIVADSSSGPNLSGTVTDLGHNISSDNSAAFSSDGSLNNTDPKLDVLADNGGPTWTMALLSGSPALDAADDSAAPATDQRGLLRPFGASSDIGAYEWATPFAIQGRVTGATLTNEVTVSINGSPMTTIDGRFGQVGLTAGSYTVTPSNANYVFVPASRTVSPGPDQLGVDFAAYHQNMLSLDGLSYGMLDVVYAGTNAQLVRVLMSTNGVNWYPYATNSVGTNNVLNINSPVNGPMRLFRTERIQ